MNDKQRQVLLNAYNSFDIETGYLDYEVIGKVMVIRRMLAELLKLDLSKHVMPGEYIDDEDGSQECRFIQEKELSINGEQSLTQKEQDLLNHILKISYAMCGVTDADDACLRCARRMLAEVLGDKPLENFRLMGESNVKPMYFTSR